MELELTGFAAGGKTVAHAPDGRVVFVEYGIPGERVIVEFKEEQPTYLEARTTEVVDASPHRIEPRCEYFGRCGGCQLQHIDYAEQLSLKTGVVQEQFERIGRFDAPPVRPMLGMEQPWAYRNHMRFTARLEGYVGFMERGTHRFLKVEQCPIAIDAVNEVLTDVQDATTGTRQIAIRMGEQSGELLVQPKLEWRPGQQGTTESGQPWYNERLLGRDFRISSAAFFQVNTRQAEHLIELVRSRLDLRGGEVLVDAYAGVGTFAVLLAPFARRVIAIEESSAAVKDAAVNIEGLGSLEFIEGKTEDVLDGLDEKPDAIILDPPRVGCHPETLEAIIRHAPKKVVYVSCDPETLARDLDVLAKDGFRIDTVEPVDMFPQTYHVEIVATLESQA